MVSGVKPMGKTLHCEQASVLITALVDGELDLDQMARIQTHLDMCEDCAQRREMEARLKGFLNRRLAQVDTPGGLEARIRGTLADLEPDTGEPGCDDPAAPVEHVPDVPDPRGILKEDGAEAPAPAPKKKKRKDRSNLVLFVSILMGSLAITLFMFDHMGGPKVQGGQLELEMLTLYRAATGGGVLQMRAEDPAQVSTWLQEQVPVVERVPDLSGLGVTPVGARVLTFSGTGPGALVLYRSASATPLVLVQTPIGALPPGVGGGVTQVGVRSVTTQRLQGVSMVHFEESGRHWLAASERDPKDLLQVVAAIR